MYYVPTASKYRSYCNLREDLPSELSAAGQRPAETNRRDNDGEVIRFIIILIFFILFLSRGPYATVTGGGGGSKIYYTYDDYYTAAVVVVYARNHARLSTRH